MAGDITGRHRPGVGTAIATVATVGVETAGVEMAGAETGGVIATATGKMKNTAALSGGVLLKAGFSPQGARCQP